jgi:alkylation response protein AidB-like acyl-CoA dehydrogenase
MSYSTQTASDREIVDQIRDLAVDFASRAEKTDRNGPMNDLLRENIQDLLRIGFFGSAIPKAYDGLEVSARAARECAKLIAAACGVTAFTQQQLHAGGNFVGKCGNDSLRTQLLPQFAKGENICGVGFSHLRRLGAPKVVAVRTDYGYRISGTIPWISAWSLLDSFILGATVSDGSMIFCYLPINDFRTCLVATSALRLSTMEASETIQLTLNDVEMPARFVLSEYGPDHMVVNDFKGIAGHTDMPLGCALGSAAFLKALGEKNGRQNVVAAANRIEKRAAEIEEQALEWNGLRFEDPD